MAKKFNLNIQSFKLISDSADEESMCNLIREKALNFSEQLLQYYLDNCSHNLHPINQIKKYLLPEDWQSHFYMTHTQTLKLEDILKRLNLIDVSFSLNSSLLDKCLEFSEIPKERTNFLIKELTYLLNPLLKNIDNKIQNLMLPLERIGAKINYPQNFEENFFTISMKIENSKNLERLSIALNQISFNQYINIIEGNDNV